MDLRDYIDHTLLKATATSDQIINLCNEAKSYRFYAVCVNGCHVSLAKKELDNSNVKVAAVIGFPLGAMSTQSKLDEVRDCLDQGADEIDMVINIGKLKEGDHSYVEEEIASIKKTMGEKPLKVIFETCYLNEDEIRRCCKLAMSAGADFVKTSTGFGSRGATKEDVIIMKEVVGEHVRIKASGGIRDAQTAKEYIELGVDRIGTSSGIEIVT
jgi:deoxyribose-phosphate aldolase